jgi:hypothetical protein
LKTECKFEKARDYLIVCKIEKYKSLFKDALDEFRIQPTSGNDEAYGKELYESYIEMRKLRDNFLEVIKYILLYGNLNIYKNLFNFFDQCDNYYKPKNNRITYDQEEFGNFYLFFFELTLCNLALLMKFNEKEYIKYLLGHTFIDKQDCGVGYMILGKQSLSTIYNKIGLKINYLIRYFMYIKKLKQDINALAEIIKENVYKEINFSDIIQADLLMHYYSYNNDCTNPYIPYLINGEKYIELTYFNNLIYKENLDIFLNIFEKDTKEELLQYFDNGKKIRDHMRYSYRSIPDLTDIIKEEFIGTAI